MKTQQITKSQFNLRNVWSALIKAFGPSTGHAVALWQQHNNSRIPELIVILTRQ